jgi:nitrogen regulatory protein PII
MAENSEIKFELIVTIVNKGFAEEVVETTKKAGAEGGTILNARGTGLHENVKLFGIPIEPEKEIVLTLIDSTKTKKVLDAITSSVELDKPGKGVAFVLEVEKTAGICHMLNKYCGIDKDSK